MLGFRSSQPHLEIQEARLECMIPDLRTGDLCGHEESPLTPMRLSIIRPSGGRGMREMTAPGHL